MKKANLIFSSVALVFALFSGAALAVELKPKVIEITKIQANNKFKTNVVALVNMDEVMDKSGDNCSQMVGTIKIEGIQFSKSGKTLEQFRFKDNKGNIFSVPTNIGELPKSQTDIANNFIKEGKSYLAHIQFCGSGGYGSLINLYDVKSSFGAFE
jgi:hypothetical protein